jgi:hypothetical protein
MKYNVFKSDEFELKFPELSWSNLKSFRIPSRAELVTSIFELKPSWIFLISSFVSYKLFSQHHKLVILRRKSIICQKKKNRMKMQVKFEGKNSCGKIRLFSDFRAEIKFSSWADQVTSLAKLKILQLELWLEPHRLELITSL